MADALEHSAVKLRALCFSLLLGGCAAQPLRVLAAGDFQPGGPIQDPLVALPLHADLRFVNLETPITSRGRESGLDSDGKPIPGATVHFAAPSDRAAWLHQRFDVVSLANNHALDHGEPGLKDTERTLAARGVLSAWRGHDAVLNRGHRTITLIARDYPPRLLREPETDLVGGIDAELDDETEVVEAVRAAGRRGVVIVSLHWGHTGLSIPSPGQRRLAARLVDAGASAVIGHGPHIPQGVERRGRAIIAYSLGNLAFGCRCSETTDAFLLRFTLDPSGSAREVRLVPIHAGIMAPASVSDDEGLRELLGALSRDLGSVVRQADSQLLIE